MRNRFLELLPKTLCKLWSYSWIIAKIASRSLIPGTQEISITHANYQLTWYRTEIILSLLHHIYLWVDLKWNRMRAKLIDSCKSVSSTIRNWEPIALSCEHEKFQKAIPLKKPRCHKRRNWITYPRRKWLSHTLTRTHKLRMGASDGRDMSLYLEWVYRECLTVRLCHATGRFSHGMYAPVCSLYLHSIFTRSRQRWFRLWKWDD